MEGKFIVFSSQTYLREITMRLNQLFLFYYLFYEQVNICVLRDKDFLFVYFRNIAAQAAIGCMKQFQFLTF